MWRLLVGFSLLAALVSCSAKPVPTGTLLSQEFPGWEQQVSQAAAVLGKTKADVTVKPGQELIVLVQSKYHNGMDSTDTGWWTTFIVRSGAVPVSYTAWGDKRAANCHKLFSDTEAGVANVPLLFDRTVFDAAPKIDPRNPFYNGDLGNNLGCGMLHRIS
jgi:hypothetical protein